MIRKAISSFRGINKFIDSKKVPPEYCDTLVNCDILSGSVIPLKTHKFFKNINTKKFFFKDGELIEQDFEYFTYYNSEIFISSSNDYPRDSNGNTLGFYVNAPISYYVYDTELPVPVVDYTLTESLTGGDLAGNTKYYYAVAYVDDVNKKVSIIKEKAKKTSIGASTKKITIGSIDDYGGHKKLVMRKWTDDKWRELAILPNGTTSYVDAVHDISNNKIVEYLSDPKKFRYGYTYYSSKYGLETQLGNLTEEIEIKYFSKLKLVIPINHSNFDYDKVRIYELGGEFSDLVLIEELDADFENGFIEYDINYYNKNILGVYNSQNNAPAPFGLKYITEYNYVLFGAVGDTLYFSEFAQPYYWGSGYNWIKFPNYITGISKVSSGLLVFTNDETYLVVGNTIDNIVVRLLSKTVGCKNFETIVNVDGNCLWVDNDYGVVLSNGFNIVYLSYPILGNYVSNLDIYQAVLHDRRIYFLHTKGVLVYDFTISGREFFFEINEVWDYAFSYNNKLYISKYNGINYDVYIAFYGDDIMPIKYISSKITDGVYTHDKEWHSLAVSYKGYGEMIVYVGGNVVLKETLDALNEYYYEVKLPNGLNTGMFLQVEINGKLELYSIEYVYTLRGNYV